MAQAPLAGGGVLADRIHFVHVYTVEAHPRRPYPSPYSGAIWELEYSEVGQQYTYAQRAQVAALVRPLVRGNQIFLVDALSPGEAVNPVWCTYGPVPNGAYLIGRDGIIRVAQEWADLDALESAARALLDE